jgi:membrane protease YdiL (CAAX protease family)
MNERDENPNLEPGEPASPPFPDGPSRPSSAAPLDPARHSMSESTSSDQPADPSLGPVSDPNVSGSSFEAFDYGSPSTPELPSYAAGQPATVVLAGDPLAAVVAHPRSGKILPEDLRVSWSWPHLLLFLFFGFASLMVVQLAFVFYISSKSATHLSSQQLEKVFEDSPQLLVGTNVIWYGLLFLFLYVTLAVLRDVPFWRSLGWRELQVNATTGKRDGWKYFFSGCALAMFVAVASYNVKNTEHLPIQEIFKNRSGALLLMGMAVLIAPLVEETVFRGYLYPLFAKSLGVLPGILLTGILFGLMHGAQLGWTWGLVLLLTFVGVVFTFARARTGTVLASFLLHLGYNSMIAVSSIIATKGFQHLPTP